MSSSQQISRVDVGPRRSLRVIKRLLLAVGAREAADVDAVVLLGLAGEALPVESFFLVFGGRGKKREGKRTKSGFFCFVGFFSTSSKEKKRKRKRKKNPFNKTHHPCIAFCSSAALECGSVDLAGASSSRACDGHSEPPGFSHASRAASTESSIDSRSRR